MSHQGPIPLSVCASMTVGELRAKVHHEFEIPADCQRWILGKQLASDDKKTLQQHSVASGGCVVFLYLVAPPGNIDFFGNIICKTDIQYFPTKIYF